MVLGYVSTERLQKKPLTHRDFRMLMEATGAWGAVVCLWSWGSAPVSPQDRRAGRLSFCTKVCYGIGGVPNQVASSATAFYLQLFLLDVAQVSVGSSPRPPILSSFHPHLVHDRQHFWPKPDKKPRIFVVGCLYWKMRNNVNAQRYRSSWVITWTISTWWIIVWPFKEWVRSIPVDVEEFPWCTSKWES